MSEMLFGEQMPEQVNDGVDTRVPERELKHAVICETCRGGYLWRVRDRTVADVLGQAHAADTGHRVWVEVRGVTRATGW